MFAFLDFPEPATDTFYQVLFRTKPISSNFEVDFYISNLDDDPGVMSDVDNRQSTSR